MNNVLFFKRLAFLIRAHVPLAEALVILRGQAAGAAMRAAMPQILSDVEAGKPLSHAFGRFPNLFGAFSLSVVAMGERSGRLPEALEYVAQELRKKYLLKRTIVGAFVYPAVIVAATFGVAAFLMFYLFPKIIPVFAGLHAALPLPTRILISTSTFLQHWGLAALVLIAVGACSLFFALKRSRALRSRFDAVCLRTPLAGGVIRQYTLAQSSRTLGLLLESGVALSDALSITAGATRNLAYAGEFSAARTCVLRGGELSAHFKAAPRRFPEIFSHLVAVGEKSGALPEALAYLSELYGQEVEEFTKNLSTLMEPVLMIFMGMLVGFIAISIITPIYGLTQNLH